LEIARIDNDVRGLDLYLRRRDDLQIFKALSTGRCGDDQVHIMEPRGIYRERKGWGDQDSARVKYDERQELDLPEDRYRNRGCQPPFDQLPWKDEIANDNV
jgi:hypothetical protein